MEVCVESDANYV